VVRPIHGRWSHTVRFNYMRTKRLTERSSLCDDFAPAGLAVVAPTDNSVYRTDIEAASQNWTKPVLVLLNVRLGISGVNPVYFPGIKSLFSFPQHVGIAGGRPSSSYYFVGCQGDSLFYIDPHYPRPTVMPRWPTDERLVQSALTEPLSHAGSAADADDWEKLRHEEARGASPSGAQGSNGFHPRSQSTSSYASTLPTPSKAAQRLDQYFGSSYSPAELSSFHPERVRKMALTGMDPSMLIGFLIKDEADFIDWRARSAPYKTSIYAIGDEPPGWAKRSGNSSKNSAVAAASPSLATLSDPATPAAEVDDGESSDADWDISDEGSDLETPDESQQTEEDWDRPEKVVRTLQVDERPDSRPRSMTVAL
jgi:cysteine protease ATG4